MSDELYEDIGQPPEHRAGAWVLLVVGILGLGLGVYHWRSTIVNAFDVPKSAFKTVEQIEQERLEVLKTKDTDADGINDFDESYIFKTSPYLEDSDSDGDSDKKELEAGTDPNCPAGRDCGPAAASSATVESSSTGTPASAEDGLGAISQMLNPSAEDIRLLLIQSGLKEEDVRKIDDATLQQLYRQAVLEAQAQAEASKN